MSKWLAYFFEKTCQTSTDKTDPTLKMREVSVMSVSALGAFERNNVISDDGKNQHVIDIALYIDYYNERAGIYEFEASDVIKNRVQAESLAMNDALAKLIEDTKTPLQSKNIANFLKKLYEETGFSL